MTLITTIRRYSDGKSGLPRDLRGNPPRGGVESIRMGRYQDLANTAEWLDLIRQTERRNRPVELRHNTGDARIDARYHKARLLKITNDFWLVERPHITDGSRNFHVGEQVVGIMGPGGKRWGFHSRVLAVQMYHLNKDSRLAALRIAAPYDIHSAQRRAFFRVSTVGSEVSEINVHPLLELDSAIDAERKIMEIHKAARADATVNELPLPRVDRPLKAQMFDLSGNGVSLLIGLPLFEVLRIHKLFWLTFTLPDIPAPLGLVASRVRATAHPEHGHVAAMQFRFHHNLEYGRFISDIICRFAADEQRRQLQRSAERG